MSLQGNLFYVFVLNLINIAFQTYTLIRDMRLFVVVKDIVYRNMFVPIDKSIPSIKSLAERCLPTYHH